MGMLQKQLKKIMAEQLDFKKQLKLLEEKANEICYKTHKQKQLENFIKKYSQFNQCLNPDLRELDPEMKKEVKTLLKDLNTTTKDIEKNIYNYLRLIMQPVSIKYNIQLYCSITK
jgi:pantoate kinase